MLNVIGLGNPGVAYELTRHNAGFLALDFLMNKYKTDIRWQKVEGSELLESAVRIKNKNFRLLKPTVFMNNSGRALISQKKYLSNEFIVIHDDLDLALGSLKVSFGRGDGGHNGVSSVINALGSKDFTRIRIGITKKNFFGFLKKPKGDRAVSDFVLAPFNEKEVEILNDVFERVGEALETFATDGLEKTMTNFNRS